MSTDQKITKGLHDIWAKWWTLLIVCHQKHNFIRQGTNTSISIGYVCFLYLAACNMKVFPLFSVWFSPHYSPESAASTISLEGQSKAFSRIFAAVVERTVSGCQKNQSQLIIFPFQQCTGGWFCLIRVKLAQYIAVPTPTSQTAWGSCRASFCNDRHLFPVYIVHYNVELTWNLATLLLCVHFLEKQLKKH